MRTVGIGAEKNITEDAEALKKENDALRASARQSDKWLKELETRLEETEKAMKSKDKQLKELKAKLTQAEKAAEPEKSK